MWALVWLQLISIDGSIKYYHISTYNNKDQCEKELNSANMLVGDNEVLVCLDLTKGRK
jgi:hypothetical protein